MASGDMEGLDGPCTSRESDKREITLSELEQKKLAILRSQIEKELERRKGHNFHDRKDEEDTIAYGDLIKTCSCVEVEEWRDQLMHHHLSRVMVKSENIETIIEEIEEEKNEEVDECIIEEYIEETQFGLQAHDDEIVYEDYGDYEGNIGESTDTEGHMIKYEKELYTVVPLRENDKRCFKCSFACNSAKTLEQHYINEHDSNNHIECPEPDCSNRFSCEKKLRTHLNKHEAEKSFRDGLFFCTICEKPCLTKARLIAHKQTHFQNYGCDYCGKKFTKFEFLQKHVTQHVTGKVKKDPNDLTNKIVCPLCSKFVPKDRMKRHTFIFHSDERPFVCSVDGCGKSFKYSEPYSNHMDMHAKNPRYKCEHCHKTFYNQSNLRQHMYRHTEPDKYRCNECNDRFGSSSSLKMHIKRLHESGNDQEVYQCAVDSCNKTFKHMANLKNHINQAHTQDNVLRKCEYCSHTCYKLKNLQKHIARVHKIKKREHRLFPSPNKSGGDHQ